MKRLLSICLAVGLALGLSLVALPAQPATAQTTINVPTIAYPTIQAGITAAGAGDTVQVAAGTYYENITLKSGVIVQGAGAGVTTIDGGGSGSVVTASFVDSTARLDGFTITNGARGIHNSDNSSPTITNNTITGNSLHGIDNSYNSSPTITNNTITGNSLDGILNYYHSSPTITNNTITGNTIYGIYNYDESSATITNSILWDNGQEIYNASDSTLVVTYSDIEGGYTGTGNTDADPLFVNPGAGDYRLQSTSPAIDTGTNAGAPADDIEGNPRPIDGDGDGTATTDMGAYEYYVVSLVLATIDIKPGSDPNSINLKSKGVIPVAILTTPDFDATTVDWTTVRFGPNAATMVHKNAHLEDVDGDGDIDMVLHFRTQDTGIVKGQTSATLTGETYSGTPIEGSDIIRVK